MSEEKERLNIYQKLQKSRVELQNKKLKKTGVNKYSNYNYFELGDFLPAINEICEKNGLCNIFHFGVPKSTLTIINCDNPEEKIISDIPTEIASLKGCSDIQNIGGTQTYAERYLYMGAYAIAESDMLDGGQVDVGAEELKKANKEGKKKISKAAVLSIKNLIIETDTDETDFLNWAKVPRIEDITNDCLGLCIQTLNKKKTKKREQPKHDENIIPTEIDF